MSKLLYVDVVGGAAGDMLLAALLDAGADPEAVRTAVDAVLPGRFEFDTEVVRRSGLRARLLRIRPGPGEPAAHDRVAEQEEPVPPAEDLQPRPFRDLVETLEAAPLSEGVASRARLVLDLLGAAEAHVHGIDPAELLLHELGDDDTLLDLVGVAAALGSLGVDRLLVSGIPLGAGNTEGGHAHGAVPLPATVTLELLKGFAVRGAGVGETVTPTGAAILAALGTPVDSFPQMRIEAIGYGAGNDDPQGYPNVVRVILGEVAVEPSDEVEPVERDLLVIEASLDDMTPELVADAAGALLAAGALDAWTTPVVMKKGRPGLVLSALCEPAAAARLRRAFFETTSTFGVRSFPVRRAELERRTVTVPFGDDSVRVKVGLLGGRIMSATPEHDDVAEVARRRGLPARHVYEEVAAVARSIRFAPQEG
ncbi:MAG TPA: nickel pincer cofactor biosynthesis protein LarC [Actinomycetota bacterium]